MKEYHQAWKQFISVSNELLKYGNRNHVGEYAEQLVTTYLNGSKSDSNKAGYDVMAGGYKYQVKARKTTSGNTCTQLSAIRNFDFDFLIVVIFDAKDGYVQKAAIIPIQKIQELNETHNDYQNALTLTTNSHFWKMQSQNITEELRQLQEF